MAQLREAHALAAESSLEAVQQARASQAFRRWLRVETDRLGWWTGHAQLSHCG